MPQSTPRLSLQARLLDGQPAAPALQKVFDERGGTIGRASQNDWVLPDAARILSAHHATVFFEGGRFQLIDCSSNGIYLNDEAEPLGPGRPAALSTGDRLQFGDYEIGVTIVATNLAASPDALKLLDDATITPGHAAAPTAAARHEPWFETSRPRDAASSMGDSAIVDPLALLGRGAASPPARLSRPSAQERDDVPVLASFFQPPKAAAPVPEDWFKTGIGIAPAAAEALPLPAPARPADALEAESLRAALDLLLQAAGLDPLRTPRHCDPKDVLQTVGIVLRESLFALRELVLQRAASRQRMGVAVTGITPRDNNPLKFAARGVGEVIDGFLFDRGPACLDAKTAIKEALQDLKAQRDEERRHLLQGVRAQLDGIDPQLIERACKVRRRLRLGTAKADCWTLYLTRHAELRRQLDDDRDGATPPPLPQRRGIHSCTELSHGLE